MVSRGKILLLVPFVSMKYFSVRISSYPSYSIANIKASEILNMPNRFVSMNNCLIQVTLQIGVNLVI